MNIPENLSLYTESCRICLCRFEEEDVQIKITPIVEEKFLILTQIELKRTDLKIISNTICESCNTKLRSFTSFRDESREKQLKLIEYIENISNLQICKEEEESHCITFEDEDFTTYITEYLEDADEDAVITEYIPDEEKIKKEFPKKQYKRSLCGLCGKDYYKDQLQRHIDKVHYKVKRYFCDVCGHGTFLKCNLATHMAKHIAKEYRTQIKCEYCESTFTRIESLKNHMKTEHETPVMLRCFCGKEFNLRHKLTTHIKRTHNNDRNHGCDLCSKKFFTPKELKVHILKHHSPGYVSTAEYFCEICGKQYSSTKSLRTHMKYHQEPEFKCSFGNCQKGFITKLLLMNHVKTHTNTRDHLCHLCEKSFFSANHLRRHISVSHDKVRVNCFIDGCRFSVGRKDYLRNHILTHRDITEDMKTEYLIRIRDMKM